MSEQISVFDFSGIYQEESFYRDDKGSSFCGKREAKLIDCKGISGTNCMCDNMAVDKLKTLIEKENVDPCGIHFIDSGNYHYMSEILLKGINEPFSLVVFDHHPDMQRPMFGDILSCGGWVLKVLENNEYVREVHIVGADKGLIGQLDSEDAAKVSFYRLQESEDTCGFGAEQSSCLPIEKLSPQYPVYLSIDKDVLSRDELITNWDQGDMSCNQLFSLIKELKEKHTILGIDICGECAPDQEDCDVAEAIRGNDDFNRRLLHLPLHNTPSSV